MGVDWIFRSTEKSKKIWSTDYENFDQLKKHNFDQVNFGQTTPCLWIQFSIKELKNSKWHHLPKTTFKIQLNLVITNLKNNNKKINKKIIIIVYWFGSICSRLLISWLLLTRVIMNRFGQSQRVRYNRVWLRGGRNVKNQNVERSEHQNYLLGWSEHWKIRTSKIWKGSECQKSN